MKNFCKILKGGKGLNVLIVSGRGKVGRDICYFVKNKIKKEGRWDGFYLREDSGVGGDFN